MVNIEWTEDAIKDLEKLDKPIVQRVLKKVDWLCDNFEKATPKPLTGELKGAFKLRVGDWRVVYTLEGQTLMNSQKVFSTCHFE